MIANTSFTLNFAGLEHTCDIQGIHVLLQKYSQLSIASNVQRLVFPQQVRLCLNAMEQLHPQLQAQVRPEDTLTMRLFHEAMGHLKQLSAGS